MVVFWEVWGAVRGGITSWKRWMESILGRYQKLSRAVGSWLGNVYTQSWLCSVEVGGYVMVGWGGEAAWYLCMNVE